MGSVVTMDVGGAMMAGVARQLGHPSGLRGRLVGAVLNRTNRGRVSAAVEALAPRGGGVVADIGFGGGVGLSLLLTSVGQSGQVHGVEVSQTMLPRAAYRYRRDIAAGRLHLHAASMTQLPFADDVPNGAVTVNTIYFIPDMEPHSPNWLQRSDARAGSSSDSPTCTRWRRCHSLRIALTFALFPK